MAAPRKNAANPGDLTARQRAAAAKKAEADNETRQAELTMATKAEEIRLNDSVVDYTDGAAAEDEGNEDIGEPADVIDPDEDEDEIEPVSDLNSTSKVVAEQDQIVLKTDKYATVRVNTAIKDMTYGAGNYYTFEVGPKYKVPLVLAEYLDSLGYLWH